ncbi:protein argonaute 16-like [Bidens hawaiensis]|uniref:protein argonaute 16-like n=1 Tax=Bidens hawaiensis TaxID=980011 RepID=UPI00404AF4E8
MKYSKQEPLRPTSHMHPPKYVPPKARGSSRSPMARSGVGTKGRKISLLTEKPSSTRVEGRVLESPKLKFGNNEHVIPCGGRWNLSKKTLVEPRQITRWAIVNFSTPCDIDKICRDLLRCCRAKGMDVEKPYSIIQENQQSTCKPASAYARVKLMFEAMEQTLPGQPQFLLCILPERKHSDIYGFCPSLSSSVFIKL